MAKTVASRPESDMRFKRAALICLLLQAFLFLSAFAAPSVRAGEGGELINFKSFVSPPYHALLGSGLGLGPDKRIYAVISLNLPDTALEHGDRVFRYDPDSGSVEDLTPRESEGGEFFYNFFCNGGWPVLALKRPAAGKGKLPFAVERFDPDGMEVLFSGETEYRDDTFHDLLNGFGGYVLRTYSFYDRVEPDGFSEISFDDMHGLAIGYVPEENREYMAGRDREKALYHLRSYGAGGLRIHADYKYEPVLPGAFEYLIVSGSDAFVVEMKLTDGGSLARIHYFSPDGTSGVTPLFDLDDFTTALTIIRLPDGWFALYGGCGLVKFKPGDDRIYGWSQGAGDNAEYAGGDALYRDGVFFILTTRMGMGEALTYDPLLFFVPESALKPLPARR